MMFQNKMVQQVKTKSTNWGYVACISALLYAAPHLWWGIGISVAFPGDYKFPDSVWSVAIGFWTMGFLAILAAFFALSFIQPWGRRIPRSMLLILGWIASVGLTFWGLGFFYLRFFIEIGRLTSSLTIYLSRFKYLPYNLGLYLVFIVLSLGYLARSYRPAVSKKIS